MIANEYQLESAKAELLKWRSSLADLESHSPYAPPQHRDTGEAHRFANDPSADSGVGGGDSSNI